MSVIRASQPHFRAAHTTSLRLGVAGFILLFGCGAIGARLGPVAQGDKEAAAAKWAALINEKKFDEAERFCTTCLQSRLRLVKVEGHKCLANVELSRATSTLVDVPAKGRRGSMRSGYAGVHVDRALNHLNQALALAPEDITIHQGRLHVLIDAMRYSQLPKNLDNSIRTYTGKDGLDHWLSYCEQLMSLSRYEAGLEFTRVLEKHYPGDHRVIANAGALLTLLERDEEALRYLKRAVVIKPDDPINNWNLARFYEFTDKPKLADEYYRKSLDVETDEERKKASYCVYARFLETKLRETARACELQRKYCGAESRTACTDKSGSRL